ncbi:hypothetical protein, partial [Bradyrhizobium sp. AUGA SZCCT0431]|uniref:hypothetical protein n=1 Tax=Bradyrhizobium sp. AUGA SZCCT0431 TaxID=2807674 RepID=UPI001BA5313B
SCAFCFVQTARETAGAARTRSSLRPHFRGQGDFWQSSGATRREIANAYLGLGHRHCERSETIHLAAQRKGWIASLRSQ